MKFVVLALFLAALAYGVYTAVKGRKSDPIPTPAPGSAPTSPKEVDPAPRAGGQRL